MQPTRNSASEVLYSEIERLKSLAERNSSDPVKYRVYTRCMTALEALSNELELTPMQKQMIATWNTSNAHWNTEFME